MYKHIVLLAVCCACVIQHGWCQKEEELCELPSGSGTCKKASECPEIQQDLSKGLQPKLCGFVGNTAVVCCRSPVTSKPRTKEPVTSDDGHYENYDPSLDPDCAPIPANATKVQKIGRKAWDKCIDYLQYVYPCEDSGALTFRPQQLRRYRCSHEVTNYTIQANDAVDGEFPHVVASWHGGGVAAARRETALGVGPSESMVSWRCVGTVISENYVLTVAHCAFIKDEGILKFVRVGVTRESLPIDHRRFHRVAEIIKHPEYKPPSVYNDIAFIKTATPIQIDNQVYPACLHTGNTVNDDRMVATGWVDKFQGSRSDTLKKAIVEKFTAEGCKDIIPPKRRHPYGLLPDSQICAGPHTEGKDVCESGVPLQIYNLDVNCMYTVVGIASVGRGCGTVGVPGVYTRVSHYISWIESIVWP